MTRKQWNELPSNYSSYVTCWRRLKTWEEDGTWKRIWDRLLSILSKTDKLMLSAGMVDGTFAPAKKRGTLLVRRRDAISIKKRPNHPIKKTKTLIAGRGYDAKWVRDELRRRNITPYIPKRRKQGQKDEPKKL